MYSKHSFCLQLELTLPKLRLLLCRHVGLYQGFGLFLHFSHFLWFLGLHLVGSYSGLERVFLPGEFDTGKNTREERNGVITTGKTNLLFFCYVIDVILFIRNKMYIVHFEEIEFLKLFLPSPTWQWRDQYWKRSRLV